MDRCRVRRRTSSRQSVILNNKLKMQKSGLLWLASACWRIVTLINITLEEDVRKPVLFLLWLGGQIPDLIRSGINRSLKGLERAGDEVESLSWEVLWIAAIRAEQGTMQVLSYTSPHVILILLFYN